MTQRQQGEESVVVLRRLDIRWMLVGSMLSSILFFSGYAQDISGQNTSTPISIPLVEDVPEIDGKLEDQVWHQAPVFDLFTTADGRIIEDDLRSQVKLMYDKSYLYFSFLNWESNPEKLKIEMSVHDKMKITEDDNVALYILPDNMQDSFLRINVNAANIIIDICKISIELKAKIKNKEIPEEMIPLLMPFIDPKAWNPKSLKTEVSIGKDYWSVEGRISFEDLLQSQVPTNKHWGWNFARKIVGERVEPEIIWFKRGWQYLRPRAFVAMGFEE